MKDAKQSLTPERGTTPIAELRDPDSVMRLERLGAFHQCRLSFMRQLTRRMQSEQWRFTTEQWQIDSNGVGHAVMSAHGPKHSYSLVAFAHDLPDDQRSDRVIAEAWDTTYALFDGIPEAADIERLSANVPYQEAGRISATELTLSRANRSVRLFEHVVDSLSAGRQPDVEQIESVGYLMRTTAVYGSGKFGAADRESLQEREEFAAPFQVEMLTVYLIRSFVRKLVEHMAQQRSKHAVPLDSVIARRIGIGNSTGLGMAPFIINHPGLFNNWIAAREQALRRVRCVEYANESSVACFRDLYDRTQQLVQLWHSDHELQKARVNTLVEELSQLQQFLDQFNFGQAYPWNQLYLWVEKNLALEAQECLVSLLLEPYPELVDDLADGMASDEASLAAIDGSQPLSEVRQQLEQRYDWAMSIDWQAPEHCARAWYVSAEKLEPRLGERFEEPIEPYEQPLAPARDAIALHSLIVSLLDSSHGDRLRADASCPDTSHNDASYADLSHADASGGADAHESSWQAHTPVAELLLKHPEHRHTVRRLQCMEGQPYAEIRDNTISAELLPIDMLRAKLSFFGAVNFDPRSDRWVRICLYANAPYPEELQVSDADTWPYPDSCASSDQETAKIL